MNNNVILSGLAVFVIALLFPFWVNLFGFEKAPEPELLGMAKEEKKCVLDKYEMRANHMSLLDEWRDSVVRDTYRQYKSAGGRLFNMSLSTGEKSCLGCHEDKAKFCDKCHTYASVSPYCWDCHINPKEI